MYHLQIFSSSIQVVFHFVLASFAVQKLLSFIRLHSSVDKESACNAGDLGSIPGSGRSPREGNGNPLHYSSLENPMDRGAWWPTVHEVARVVHDLATRPPRLHLFIFAFVSIAFGDWPKKILAWFMWENLYCVLF